MTKFNHTPEPWSVYKLKYSGRRKAYSGQIRAIVETNHGPQEGTILVPARYGEHCNTPLDAATILGNLERASACVNGCAGIEDPETTVPWLANLLEWITRCAHMSGPAGTTAYFISDETMEAAKAAVAKAKTIK